MSSKANNAIDALPSGSMIKLINDTLREMIFPKEAGKNEDGGSVRSGDVNLYYKGEEDIVVDRTYTFRWENYHRPHSRVHVFRVNGERFFDVELGNEESFEPLTPYQRQLHGGIMKIFHAREGHIVGYTGEGYVPLELSYADKSGSRMRSHETATVG